jgi:G3E family GTPase
LLFALVWLHISDGLPQGLFRAKGIVHLNSPSACYVFQLCGGRVAFESYVGDIADTRLVFIGRNIDGSLLRERIEACRLPQRQKNEQSAWLG